MYSFETVRNGSIGSDVVCLQLVLSLLHYTGADGKPLNIDGECGTNTVYAIKRFQSDMKAYGADIGASSPDGIFGEKCWNILTVR